jgi:hypothetical protein
MWSAPASVLRRHFLVGGDLAHTSGSPPLQPSADPSISVAAVQRNWRSLNVRTGPSVSPENSSDSSPSALAGSATPRTRRGRRQDSSLPSPAGLRLHGTGAWRRSPSLPLSAIESTALKSRVDPLRTNRPEPAICPREGVDFNLRELEAPVPQRCECFDRSLEKIGAELLVCQNLPDDQLHGSLRHIHRPGVEYLFRRTGLRVAPVTASVEQVGCRRASREKTAQIRRCTPAAARGEPSGSTRRARQHAAEGSVAMPTGWKPPGIVGTTPAFGRRPRGSGKCVQSRGSLWQGRRGARRRILALLLCGHAARGSSAAQAEGRWRSVSIRQRTPANSCPCSTTCWRPSQANSRSVTSFNISPRSSAELSRMTRPSSSSWAKTGLRVCTPERPIARLKESRAMGR